MANTCGVELQILGNAAYSLFCASIFSHLSFVFVDNVFSNILLSSIFSHRKIGSCRRLAPPRGPFPLRFTSSVKRSVNPLRTSLFRISHLRMIQSVRVPAVRASAPFRVRFVSYRLCFSSAPCFFRPGSHHFVLSPPISSLFRFSSHPLRFPNFVSIGYSFLPCRFASASLPFNSSLAVLQRRLYLLRFLLFVLRAPSLRSSSSGHVHCFFV